MLINSPMNARTQIVSVSSSWGGVSLRLKRQWLSKFWVVLPTLAGPHLHGALPAAVHCKQPRAKEKPYHDRLHLLLLSATTSLPLCILAK